MSINPSSKIPKSQVKIISEKQTERRIAADGTEQVTVAEKTRAIQRSDEPDYIKLYTRMWCEFNAIPDRYRPLFLELITRMSYCNKADLDTSQIVYTGEPNATAICKALGWKQKDSLMKGLKALCKCEAIKKVNRAVYQINPNYAGRGEWKYNPRLDRGGVEDLIAVFSFKNQTVQTKIVWADDGKGDDVINNIYRAMLETDPKKDISASLTHQQITPEPPEDPADE